MDTLASKKTADTDYPIHHLIADRWSPRAFADKPIPKAIIGGLLEAARWSASSSNKQPWSFIIATQDDSEAFDKMLNVLKEGNQIWAKSAPLLMLAVAHHADKNRIAMYDLGLAVQNITTQALSNDLYVHQMGGIYRDKAEEIYYVPEEHSVVVAIAIGYLGDADTLPDNLKARELATRTRKPLSEFVFNGDWGDTADIAKKA